MNKPAKLEPFLLEPERYEFRALPTHQFALARRDFFKLLSAGIAVFAVAKDLAAQETAPGPRGFHSEELPKEIGAWLHIGEDGTVTGFVGKAKMGQNVRTALAQTIADELGVPFERVHMVLADTALTPWDAGTFGSRTTPTITPQLRLGGGSSARSVARESRERMERSGRQADCRRRENYRSRVGALCSLFGFSARRRDRPQDSSGQRSG